MVFVLVDNGQIIRVNRLMEQHRLDVGEGKRVPKVVIVDATIRKSASKR